MSCNNIILIVLILVLSVGDQSHNLPVKWNVSQVYLGVLFFMYSKNVKSPENMFGVRLPTKQRNDIVKPVNNSRTLK